MRVYLDNNVLVDIEDGKYNLSDFMSIPDVEYYYSDAHLIELLEAVENPKVSQEGRIELISEICGQNCILQNPYAEPEFLQKPASEMYNIANTPYMRSIRARFIKMGDVFERIRLLLGFDCKTFNNERPENIFGILDCRMQEKLQIGLLEYLISSEALSGRPLFSTLLNIVDAANYWRDVKTNHSDVARLHDASHAYFAQICDVLVTNDRRMRIKVTAIYSFLGISTTVIPPKDFLKMNPIR